jgi:hypothetical protein
MDSINYIVYKLVDHQRINARSQGAERHQNLPTVGLLAQATWCANSTSKLLSPHLSKITLYIRLLSSSLSTIFSAITPSPSAGLDLSTI